MLTDQRLHRARALEPVMELGGVIYMIDSSSFPQSKYTTPFFVVAGIEPIFGIGPHNFLLLWNQASASVAPAGYGLTPGTTQMIPEAKGGANLNNGTSVTISNPQILQGNPLQLLHYRFALKSLALTGAKEHDLEMQVFSPGKQTKFGLPNAGPGGGYSNIADQFPDPADVVDAPAQGANEALPTVFPNVHPKDDGNLREFFVWEDNGPSFQIWNNGSAAITAGAVGVRIWGFRYDLVELDPAMLESPYGQDRWLYGRVRRCPPTDSRIAVLATAPYNATPSNR